MMKALLITVVLFNLQFLNVSGHGRLIDPPSRASAWRYGFKTPADYNDNQGFCGGFAYQYQKHGGKCGICGDPWGGPKTHETPGKFATGTITASYAVGQTIKAKVQITANHWGKFTFRLCANNNPSKDPTQACFDSTVLKQPNGDTEWKLPTHEKKVFEVDLVLPSGLECSQCILQWTYKTANSWGTDPDGTGCIGCGAQEHFRACADIKIGSGGGSPAPAPPAPAPPAPAPPAPAPPAPAPPSGGGDCVAAGRYKYSPGMDDWCKANCPATCPPTHCVCT